MAQNITISRTAGTRALLTDLITVSVLLIARMAENTLTGLKTARNWIQAQHSFMAKTATPSSEQAGSSSAITSPPLCLPYYSALTINHLIYTMTRYNTYIKSTVLTPVTAEIMYRIINNTPELDKLTGAQCSVVAELMYQQKEYGFDE